MNINAAGLAIIEGAESFRASPYLCPGGYWTYGWGAIWDANGQRVTPATVPISLDEAGELLKRDVAIAERAVSRLCGSLSENRFSALVSFTYNLGSGALQRSALRLKVLHGDHSEVPREFLCWIIAGGQRRAGLVTRRKAEASLYQLDLGLP